MILLCSICHAPVPGGRFVFCPDCVEKHLVRPWDYRSWPEWVFEAVRIEKARRYSQLRFEQNEMTFSDLDDEDYKHVMNLVYSTISPEAR